MKNFFTIKSLSCLFVFTVILTAPSLSLGYIDTTGEDNISAEIYPDNPTAFTNVTIRLIGYGTDLERSDITWINNGKKQGGGIGQDEFKFTTGAIGKKVTIIAQIETADGTSLTKQYSFIPADVDILWQSDGYTPPFYRGKSIAVEGSNLKLVAMPDFITENGTKVDPKKLFYSWRINSKDIASGYGKYSTNASISNPDVDNTVYVEVTNMDETLRATKNIKISPQRAQILLYESNPLLGTVYNKTIVENYRINELETTVNVVPYFLNKNGAQYSWGINDEKLSPTKNNESKLIMRLPAYGSGSSLLNVLVKTPYQTIEKSVKINYGR